MRLNSLKPAFGAKAKKVRLGRGIGSGLGKTCGYGHKGQKARSGYGRKSGFEGGQLPLQRRLPKFGFNSHKKHDTAEVRLQSLNGLKSITDMNLEVLKDAKLIKSEVKLAKIILCGEINHAVNIFGNGIKVTKGAKHAIVAAGGTVVG